MNIITPVKIKNIIEQTFFRQLPNVMRNLKSFAIKHLYFNVVKYTYLLKQKERNYEFCSVI